jgi:hypothetical protein
LIVTRPVKRPKEGLFATDEDEAFERQARAELQRVAITKWPQLRLLWLGIHKCLPSTRRRILSHCLDVAEAPQHPLPTFVKNLLQSELKAGKPRNRVRDFAQMHVVARHLARNPDCSLGELAKAANMKTKNKTTLLQYMQHELFWQIVNNEAYQNAERLSEDVTPTLQALGKRREMPKKAQTKRGPHRRRA